VRHRVRPHHVVVGQDVGEPHLLPEPEGVDGGIVAVTVAVTAGKSEALLQQPPPVRSPLFEVLNDKEREALIKEMELETHEEGSVIISEGDPGDSMYVISSGEVKVYTRGTGKSGTVYLAKLGEGDFFGEVSVLTGKPRTATITASQPTELLRLDKEKLDNALAKHPGVRKVLDEFYKKRANNTVEAMIENLKKRAG